MTYNVFGGTLNLAQSQSLRRLGGPYVPLWSRQLNVFLSLRQKMLYKHEQTTIRLYLIHVSFTQKATGRQV